MVTVDRDVRTAWYLSAAAMIPILLAYALHFSFAPPGGHPTGFLQYDQLYYMSIAKAVATEGFPFLYGLPFSPDDTTPKIYFQPQAVVLGAVLKLSGADPGVVYTLFGLLAGLTMFRAAIALYRSFGYGIGDAPARLACFSVLWGGGYIVLLGLLQTSLRGPGDQSWMDSILSHDPGAGFWFLNLGRNAYYATEAYYHTLFFLTLTALLRGRLGLCVLLASILSASHPFTGLELLLILAAFTFSERFIAGNRRVSVWAVAAFIGLSVLHVGYYMAFLNNASPEHRALFEQWSIPWILPFASIIPAYLVPLLLSVLRVGRTPGWLTAAGSMPMRLALAWFCVAFALANHEVLLTPRQPLHFTRGYIFTPLALLAAPAIEAAFRALLTKQRMALACVLALAILLDNLTWFGWRYGLMVTHADTDAIYVSDTQRYVLSRLSAPDVRDRLLISDDAMLSYLATAYVPMRAWYSHVFNTPYAEARKREIDRFFQDGTEPPYWAARRIVLAPRAPAPIPSSYTSLGVTGGHALAIRDPR